MLTFERLTPEARLVRLIYFEVNTIFTNKSLLEVFKARSGKPLKNKLIYSIDGRHGRGKENQ